MLLGLWLSLSMAFAETTSDIEVLVKGMVCSFCVQGVEKKFGGEDAGRRDHLPPPICLGRIRRSGLRQVRSRMRRSTPGTRF